MDSYFLLPSLLALSSSLVEFGCSFTQFMSNIISYSKLNRPYIDSWNKSENISMTIKITTSNTQNCGRRKEFETTELLLLLQKLFSVERV